LKKNISVVDQEKEKRKNINLKRKLPLPTGDDGIGSVAGSRAECEEQRKERKEEAVKNRSKISLYFIFGPLISFHLLL
jgi:hypothetical protein